MQNATALCTGAGGEMGRLLVPALRERGFDVVAVDLAELPPALAEACVASAVLDILDTQRLATLVSRHRPSLVLHLAALLSSQAERDPERAHRVNVDGTRGLFRLLEEAGRPVRFMFPSSIAVYGLPGHAAKDAEGALTEWQWTVPAGIYGANKLYCELLGAHATRRSTRDGRASFDFRSIRFPGLISAETLPAGGTTDYAPEMIHAAARGEGYSCFVEADTRLPFMTMPDGVEALLCLAEADEARLTTRVYNARGFSSSAGEIREEALRHFPQARIEFVPVPAKQAICDSWPADVDDSAARRDWGFAPRHDLAAAFGDYLVPALTRRYATVSHDAARND